MSYFKCRRGEKYFPFGQGGRDNLLRGLHMSALGVTSPSSATGTDTDTVKPAVDAVVNKAMQRLQECPLHALPLSQTISSTYYNTNSPSSSNTTFEGRWEADSIYNALADDVILEIYKLKMSQQMVPMISYSEGSDEIILRDIFVDRAIEHRISAVELRIRDPTTGINIYEYIYTCIYINILNFKLFA